jgi:hypothetical protein
MRSATDNDLILIGGAVLLGWVLLSKLSTLPGVQAVSKLFTQGISFDNAQNVAAVASTTTSDIIPAGNVGGASFFTSGLAEYVTGLPAGTLFAFQEGSGQLWFVYQSEMTETNFTKQDMINAAQAYNSSKA